MKAFWTVLLGTTLSVASVVVASEGATVTSAQTSLQREI
jgi:hypothetical protein